MNDLDQLVDLAKLFMEDQQFQKSIQYLQMADKLDNNHMECIYLHAFCCFQVKDYNTAKEILEEVKENQKMVAMIEEDEDMKGAYMDLHQELSKVHIVDEKEEDMQMEEEEQNWEEI